VKNFLSGNFLIIKTFCEIIRIAILVVFSDSKEDIPLPEKIPGFSGMPCKGLFLLENCKLIKFCLFSLLGNCLLIYFPE